MSTYRNLEALHTRLLRAEVNADSAQYSDLASLRFLESIANSLVILAALELEKRDGLEDVARRALDEV